MILFHLIYQDLTERWIACPGTGGPEVEVTIPYSSASSTGESPALWAIVVSAPQSF